MKKVKRLLAFVLALAMVLSGLPGMPNKVKAAETWTAVTVKVGETVETIESSWGTKIENWRFESSDGGAVASVSRTSSGNVSITGDKIGTGTLVIQDYNNTDYVYIPVTVISNEDSSGDDTNVPVASISLDKTSATIGIDETVQLTATVLPENASNKNVTWSSSDSGVATVDNGLVKGISAGENVTITATTEDGGKTASALITVTAVQTASFVITPNQLNLAVGETGTLTADNIPEGTTVTWSSSDDNIATVDGNGIVTAVAASDTPVTITATAGDQTATASVTVSAKTEETPDSQYTLAVSREEIVIQQGGSATISATAKGPDAPYDYILYSLDTSASSYSGLIKFNQLVYSGVDNTVSIDKDVPVGEYSVIVQISDHGQWSALADSPVKTIKINVIAKDPTISLPASLSIPVNGSKEITATVTDLPEGAKILWEVSPAGNITISESEANNTAVLQAGSAADEVKLTATIVDSNNAPVKDYNGNEIKAETVVKVYDTAGRENELWILDTSGSLIDGAKYAFVAYDSEYAMTAGENSFAVDNSVITLEDGIAYIIDTAAWTYSADNGFSSGNNSLAGCAGFTGVSIKFDDEGNILLTDTANENTGIQFKDNAFISTGSAGKLRLYRKVAATELTTELYIAPSSALTSTDDGVSHVGSASKSFGITEAVNGYKYNEVLEGATFEDASGNAIASPVEDFLLGKVVVNGKAYTGKELDTLELIPARDTNIQYYYLTKETTVEVEWYFVAGNEIVTDQQLFTKDTVASGITYVGSSTCTVTRSESDTTNLLSDPKGTFGLENVATEESVAETLERLKSRAATLIDMRSGRIIKPNQGNEEGARRQWIYASSRNANNYLAEDWRVVEDSENKPLNIWNSEAVLLAKDLDDSGVIKLIYSVEERVNIEYYFLEKDTSGEEKEILIGTSYTTKNANSVINIPVFNAAAPVTGTGKDQINFVNPWPADVPEATKLVNKAIRLYDEMGTEQIYMNSVLTQMQLILDGNAGTPIPGSQFTLKVYFVKEAVRTRNVIQLPTVFRDFKGDGMLFEFELIDQEGTSNDYGLTRAPEAGHPDAANGQLTTGLVKDELDADGNIVYTQATVGYLAGLINKGISPYAFENTSGAAYQRYTDVTAKIFEVGSGTDNLGTWEDVTAALADGEVTFDEVTNAMTGAYYLLSHIWEDSVTGEGELNKKVTEINSIQLQEYFDGVDYYFEYDSNKYETSTANGVVSNTETLMTAPAAANAYFHPIDGLGYGNDYQQYGSDINFLFSTEGRGKFVYDEEKNLYFDFSGDDDVYLFINNKLVLDCGGAHPAVYRSVYLNDIQDEMGLVDGQVYDFAFYHVERRSTGSNFRMRTNIEVTAPSMITEKKAYQDNNGRRTLIPNGSVVDTDKLVEYEFVLHNEGDVRMFNLSFEDQTIGVRIYPYGSTVNCKFGGKADQFSQDNGYGKIGDYLSEEITPGSIQIEIYETEDGAKKYPDIKNYKFEEKNLAGTTTMLPVDEQWIVGDNIKEGVVGYGTFEAGTTIAAKYKQLYDVEPTDEQCIELLRKVILNGLEPGQTIVLNGFQRRTQTNETFTNRLNTYGIDIQYRTVRGTASTTVRTLNAENRIFVIDYGKKSDITKV